MDDAAIALLEGSPPNAALARSAGCRDAPALQRALRKALRVDADGLAALGGDGRYTLAYGAPFHVEQALRYLARDPNNVAEHVEGATYRRFFPLGTRQVSLALTLHDTHCDVALQDGATALSPVDRLALHRRLVHFLGLDQPLQAFYREVRDDRVMGPLVRRLRGVRIPQVPSLWEALCWAIIGQQINLAFAYRLRNRFIAMGNGLAARAADDLAQQGGPPLPFPGPEQVLAVPEPAWRSAQFSRQKAAYLAGVARAFLDGTLVEDALAAAAPEEAAATLHAVKGLGPWSVAYGLLRALGQTDALPVGDAGLRAALRHHYDLPGPPDPRTQEALMEPFRPYRGLATVYFWKSLDQMRQD